MKKVALIFILIFVGALCFGISRVMQNPEKYKKQDKEISAILDCSKFSRISTNELKTELGEPKRIDSWNNQNSKGTFPMEIYTYDFNDFYGEFIIYENQIVKLRLFSNSKWEVEGSNADNIFAMFGIVPGENAKKTVDTGITYKFSPVSDKVAEIEFYNYEKKNKSFDTVYVTYNLNYFD